MSNAKVASLDGAREHRAAANLVDIGSVVAAEWSRRDGLLRRGLALSDALTVVGALGLAVAISDIGRPDTLHLLLLAIAYVPVWIVLFKVYGLYDRDVQRISHAVLDEVPWVVHASLIGSLGMWLVARIFAEQQLAFSEGVLFFALAVSMTLAFRVLVRRLMILVMGPERLVVIGYNGIAPWLAQKLSRHPEYGVRPIGTLTPEPAASDISGLPWLGSPENFAETVRERGVERALVCHEGLSAAEVTRLVDEGRRLGVKVGIVPDTVEALGYSVEIDDVEGVTILSVNPPVLSRTSRMLKRGFDLAIVSLFAVPALALGLATALAIKLDSRGPVFYRQERVGRGGRTFRLIKFRTMREDADEMRAELMERSRDPNWLHLQHDPRITRVGGLLRLFSLDEVPQIINVLKGEMSLVGPRPLIHEESGQVSGWARARHDLTPGMTGLWQVLGRTDIPFEEMVKLDYMYVTNWSLWLDVKLLLRTVPAVLARRGAN